MLALMFRHPKIMDSPSTLSSESIYSDGHTLTIRIVRYSQSLGSDMSTTLQLDAVAEQKGNTQMQNTKPIYTFVTDKPNGGMIVECSVCEGQFDTPNSLESVPQFQTQHTCPHCKTDVVYPDGASW
jgi:hypothetical protein